MLRATPEPTVITRGYQSVSYRRPSYATGLRKDGSYRRLWCSYCVAKAVDLSGWLTVTCYDCGALFTFCSENCYKLLMKRHECPGHPVKNLRSDSIV